MAGTGGDLSDSATASFKSPPQDSDVASSPMIQLSLNNRCVHELIAAQAETKPDAIALVAGGKRFTYSRLNAMANQLACFLRTRGVGPEVLVGLCLKRSAEMIVAMLGILKAGGAYVPLDSNDPPERQAFELQDSGAKVLVTTANLAKALPVEGRTVLRYDADWPEIARKSQANLEPAARLDHPAYVIYTSGSTGRPKGVVVTHAGLTNYLSWAAKEYGKEARRSSLLHSSISFDLTVTALYTPLLVGGRIEVLPEEPGVEALVRALRQPGIHGLVKITPAHLELLSRQLHPEEAAGKVELFVIGGENLTAESLRFWREVSPSTRLINEYGPTETVVGCCVYQVQPGDPFTGSVPIGRAIENTNLYVLDPRLEPVPAGITGELYIGGSGVARGYLNRPEMTLEAFLTDPFSDEPGARMYKTGDMARCREDGTLEYLGRVDNQVKIRGHRVELGEIDAALAAHASVHQCLAVAREDGPGKKQLVSYVILRQGRVVTSNELRDFLRRKLPEYMVPAHYVFLEAFPLGASGKVDRHALPVPDRTVSRQEFIAPRNASESKLAAIWTELLGVNPVSVTDNFLDLGGDSLLMTILLMRIEEQFQRQLSVPTLFEAPTVQQLAVILESPAESTAGVIAVQPAGSLPPFFCIGAGPLFRPLALRLGTDRPFLSLMPTLLPLGQLATASQLEQIAADMVKSVFSRQKEGPYYLGGWSASGIIAYEVARQLIESGHEVALLALFDTKNPRFQASALKETWFDSRAKKIKFQFAELSRVKLKSVPAYFADKAAELSRKIDVARLQIRHKIRERLHSRSAKTPEEIVALAVRAYRPLPYGGRVLFFKAAERPPGDSWDLSCGWRDLVTGDFQVYEVPGDHRSMFLEPNVEILASIMLDKFYETDSGQAALEAASLDNKGQAQA